MTQTEGRGRSTPTRPDALAPSQNYEAIRQRKRRADPVKRAREKLIERLRQETLEELAKAHEPEFIKRLNEKRLAHGLSVYHPGAGSLFRLQAKRRRQAHELAAHEVVIDPMVQATCRHDQGLKKLPYGVFCAIETCGKRIR